MVDLFQSGIPVEGSALKSAEIRQNLEALFERLKALEPRAQLPVSTSISLNGGPVYFRPSTSRQLTFFNFATQIFDFATGQGYKTRQDTDGTLYRTIQGFTGPSDFNQKV